MVYLFEDRKKRQYSFMQEQKLSSLKCKEAVFDYSGDNLEEYILDSFPEARVILFHKSYNIGKWSMFEIENIFSKNGATFVQFSGDNIDNQAGLAISTRTMYKNILMFIADYESNSKPRIGLLYYGENYLQNELLGLRSRIQNFFFDQQGLASIAELKELWDIVDDNIVSTELLEKKRELMEWLKKQETKEQITKERLKQILIKWIEKNEAAIN